MDYAFKLQERGVLSGEDLFFFYYNVFRTSQESIVNAYDWNNEIIDFLTEEETTIETCDFKEIPDDYQENTLLFVCLENESIPIALMRHLRNAFSHMRIRKDGSYYLLEDIAGKQDKTMIGKIKCECLKRIVFMLIKQGEEFKEEIDKL